MLRSSWAATAPAESRDKLWGQCRTIRLRRCVSLPRKKSPACFLPRNICSEYGEYNIQCNGIGPGYIATPQTAPLRERQPDGSRHPFDQFIVAKTPAARMRAPDA